MSDDNDDAPLDWRREASAVVGDVERHVKHVAVSPRLASSPQRIYLNVTTLEDRRCCVELSGEGFAVVGEDHDLYDDEARSQTYETPYSLLASLSAGYGRSFAGELAEKLEALKDDSNSISVIKD